MMCTILSLFCLTWHWRSRLLWAVYSNCLKINREDNWKDELAPCFFSQPYLQWHRPAWYLYATCWLALNWSTARITQKPKVPRLPASHHLAQTHHVNFMTTACYHCQFCALSRIDWDTHKSLWHSSFIMLFLSLFDGLNERFREMLNPVSLVR